MQRIIRSSMGLCLVLVVLFIFTACGGAASDADGESDNTAVSVAAVEAAEDSHDADEVGGAHDEDATGHAAAAEHEEGDEHADATEHEGGDEHADATEHEEGDEHADATEHEGGDEHADVVEHEAGSAMETDDHSGDDHMAMAAAHGVPEEAAAVANPIAYDAESVAAGATSFSQTCAVCHGPEGAGDGPGSVGLDPKPANLSEDHVQANSDGAIFYIISNGRTGTAMVGWEGTYSETQRWQLVNFVRSLVAE